MNSPVKPLRHDDFNALRTSDLEVREASASEVPGNRNATKQGVLVLGMHRSGTSAVTRVMNLLGCALPQDLIGPGDGNVLGHWESSDAVTLNDEILASAGSTWEDWGPINEDWRQSGLRPEMLSRVVDLVNRHAALGPLFALKDPRLCRLADLWLEAMDIAGVEPLVLLMLRNPLEVVRSLESRDLMAPAYAQLLWLRHVLDAEFASRGRKRVVCRYDQMMRNWYGMIARIKSGLDLALPRNSPAVRAEVESFLASEERHQEIELDAALENSWLSHWLRRTLAIMVRWSEQGEVSADYAELDAIRDQFDNAHSAMAALLLDPEITGNVGAGSRLKAQLNEQLGSLEAVRRELHEQLSQNAELSGRLSLTESTLVQRQEELAQLWEELRAAGEASGAAQAEAEHEQARRLEAEDRVQALEAQTRDLTAKLDAASEAKEMTERAFAEQKQENATLSARLEQQESASKVAESARIEAEQKLAARFDELARLTKLLMAEGEQVRKATADADWLRQMNQLSNSFPKWWSALPDKLRRRKEHARYRRAGLFDVESYLKLYPDVGQDGMDPVRHYILHGMAEARIPVQ